MHCSSPGIFFGLRISLSKSVCQFLEPTGVFEGHCQLNRLNEEQTGVFFSQNFNLWRNTRLKSKPRQNLFTDLIDGSNTSFIKALVQRILAVTRQIMPDSP